MKSLPSDLEIRRLNGTDAEAFQVLRRELTTDNPVPMGLTLDEEMARTLEGFRDQLSYPEPNAAFGAFVSGSLVGTAAERGRANFCRHGTRPTCGASSSRPVAEEEAWVVHLCSAR